MGPLNPSRLEVGASEIIGVDELVYVTHVTLIILQIYDIQTGQKLLTLYNPDLANNYKRNCATFNPTDDLVLNDGVLWDVRSAQAIHKFDKFNMNISGVFHPNGLEVIVNTEIVSSAESQHGGL